MAEFRSNSLDELLANFEFVIVKEYVEMRSHKAAQAQVTVTPDDTVQHCSPCSPNPDMPSDVCFRWESSEGKMGPELKELELPSVGTGLETPGQQCPPNEGIWETGRTTASGILSAGVGTKGEKAPPWNAAVTLLYFSGESWETPYLCFSVCALSVLCVCSVS